MNGVVLSNKPKAGVCSPHRNSKTWLVKTRLNVVHIHAKAKIKSIEVLLRGYVRTK